MNDETDLQTVNRHQWLTLKNSLFPGASEDSIKLVLSYCVARGLDPMKKPCHIVPMRVKDSETGEYRYRDVVMPGIYELRTTAQKTGEYIGQDEPIFGAEGNYEGVAAPETCKIKVHRWHTLSGQVATFTGTARFSECVGTKGRSNEPNDRWKRAPYQMLEKCAEAAALRKAFPDELGGQYAMEELAGQAPIDTGPALKPVTAEPEPIDVTPGKQPEPRPGPRAGPAPVVVQPDKAAPDVADMADAQPEGELINATQAGLLVKKAIAAGIRETDLVAHFDLTEIRQLPLDKLPRAKAWIKEVGGGGD